MTDDPYRVLDLRDAPDTATIKRAVKAAIDRGVPAPDALRAQKTLLNADHRAELAFLSVTQTPSWERLHRGEADPHAGIRPLLRRIAAAVLEDMARELDDPTVLPEVTVERDIRQYVRGDSKSGR